MTGRASTDGWEEHRRAQLASHLLATPAQRLRWLEEAIAFARRTGALPKPGTGPDPKPGSRHTDPAR